MENTAAVTQREEPMPAAETLELVRYINLKLASLGQPVGRGTTDGRFLEIAGPLLRNYYQKEQLFGGHLCAADSRIQAFLDDTLGEVCPGGVPRLPTGSFVLDRPGVARVLSLPAASDRFTSPYLNSYRVAQGALHNPRSDRRTTQGGFHIAEGGFPIPADKIAIPKQTFARLLESALHPPDELLTLPFTADQQERGKLFVSLLLRPVVCPETAQQPAKTMEIRFFAPGSFVSNLDFVESIFGNGGDPYLYENDAAIDVEHWTGHSGCVILAPHLTGLTKKDLGLPHVDQASQRQRRDGMCWSDAGELYNGGHAFKATCRDGRGVMVTLIADNYFGYCKKEVKTQISFAANLFGLCEEEHAGGAVAFPTYILGQDFYFARSRPAKERSFEEAMDLLAGRVERRPEGYAVDRRYPDVLYVPETSDFNLREGTLQWPQDGSVGRLTLRAGECYVLPSGYRVRAVKHPSGSAWRLVGTRPNGTLCHKPCTVSGGGKSEISKSIANVLLFGPIFVRDYHRDMEMVASILKRDFSRIYRDRPADARSRRPILSSERSLGSVIKLLTPSDQYTDEHNEWLGQLPQIIRQLVCTLKRYYRPEWGDQWRQHFTVDRINGYLGHELKFDNQKLVSNYLRVGYDPDGSWRIYKLRPDFHPADKVQVEDDISATVVLPRESLDGLDPDPAGRSIKLVHNCEMLLFQRPDDAIHRGVDRQAEADIAAPGVFLSNYEPLTRPQARQLVDHTVEFDLYTEPMKRLLDEFSGSPDPDYVVSSAHPRLLNGKPCRNPRYLQTRPDIANDRDTYLAEISSRLNRGVPTGRPLFYPVNAVLAGRRNSPADPGIGLPPLAVYNPVHYQELPELFMDFICSLTGKSPSTTGFGSEGALTKGPFNALPPVVDVNNALVAAALTGYAGFTTSAGYVGPQYRVDHDISMLIPEIWCRMTVDERDPRFLIENGYLEKLADFDFEGRRVLASRLGYRITQRFADHFLGRIFEVPDSVFTEELLRPEKQDAFTFASGVDSIVDAQRRVALLYFDDGGVELACPPVKALLHVMAFGSYEGKGIEDAGLRAMFTREAVMSSDWYRERLRAKQRRDVALWKRHTTALDTFRPGGSNAWFPQHLNLEERHRIAREQLERVSAPAYLKELEGTIGADPFC
jgi:phosphoenolpyruvate carboxykinase (diphosphate)